MAAELVTADGEVLPAFGSISIPREYVMARDGKDYVLSDGLLVALGQLSRGYYDVATDIVQLPTAENANTAVVTARVTVFDPEGGRTLRTASGIGDASPANVGRMVAIHCLRMAETRAVARALRHLLGVGMTALEELGGGAQADEAPPPPAQPARFDPPVERIQVDGKPYTRVAVRAIYAKRVAAAQEAGLTLAPADVVADDAPLAVLVGKAQELRRRLEVRAGAVRS